MIGYDADTALSKIKGAAREHQENCVARASATVISASRRGRVKKTKARGAPHDEAAATRLLHAPEDQAADLISIFLAGAGFGILRALLAIRASRQHHFGHYRSLRQVKPAD